MGKREREEMGEEAAVAPSEGAQQGLKVRAGLCEQQLLLVGCCCCTCSGGLLLQFAYQNRFTPVLWLYHAFDGSECECDGAIHLQDSVMRPRKAFYRARAHSNPFNDGIHLEIPPNPDAYDW